jgi:hypothetical protein
LARLLRLCAVRGWFRPQHPLSDVQGTLVEGPGGGKLAPIVEQVGQVVQGAGGMGMVGPQHPLEDGDGALEEGFGGGQLALLSEQLG